VTNQGSSDTGPVPCRTDVVAQVESGAKIKIEKFLGQGSPPTLQEIWDML
jgi:hypothetical protein